MSSRSTTTKPCRGSTSPPPAVSRLQPMTGEQAARLKELAAQALEPEAYHSGLTAGEAARRIKALEVKLRIMDGPPHTV